jgi:hypothetical protein
MSLALANELGFRLLQNHRKHESRQAAGEERRNLVGRRASDHVTASSSMPN